MVVRDVHLDKKSCHICVMLLSGWRSMEVRAAQPDKKQYPTLVMPVKGVRSTDVSELHECKNI